MSMTAKVMKRAELLASIEQWAISNENVWALIQTGSLVRDDGLADDFSDLDLEIYSYHPALLVESDSWIDAIGRPITILHLDAEEGQPWSTRLVIFEGGLKVDFTLTEKQRLEQMINTNTLDSLYQRGYRTLFDKTGFTDKLPAPSFAPPTAAFPTEKYFLERVEEFWFEAFHIPVYLARNELFLVKQRDWTMKELLLEMMEWHALARSEGSADVWHMGKGVHSWTDKVTWQQLQRAFGHFDAEDARRAFEVTKQLYRRLAQDVAKIKGWRYPHQVEERISALDPVQHRSE